MEIKELSYEEALSELKVILNRLENDDLTLEKSLEMFKKGIELYKYCNNILTKTEGEVKVLLDEGEIFEEISFIKEEDGNY